MRAGQGRSTGTEAGEKEECEDGKVEVGIYYWGFLVVRGLVSGIQSFKYPYPDIQ